MAGNKTTSWLLKSQITSLPRNLLIKALRNRNLIVVRYDFPERQKAMKLITQVKKETKMLLGYHEAYQIYSTVKKTAKIKGDIAEVGVYLGGSAKIISEAKANKTLHLFDTFEGLPELTEKDNPQQFHKGKYNSSYEQVKNYLKNYQNLYFYKGMFPQTGLLIKNKKFSFIHLDVDLYKPTLDCLKFFYPRMSKGGVIISHDYVNAPGVKKAFEEFFQKKPEPIIELSGLQCMIVKV